MVAYATACKQEREAEELPAPWNDFAEHCTAKTTFDERVLSCFVLEDSLDESSTSSHLTSMQQPHQRLAGGYSSPPNENSFPR